MTIREFYEKVGGSYEEAMGRFMNEARIIKYIGKFEASAGIEELKTAVAEKNCELAFRSAHTLKGVCLNMCFGRLAKVSSELTELYRNRIPTEDTTPYLNAVVEEYGKVLAAIAELNG